MIEFGFMMKLRTKSKIEVTNITNEINQEVGDCKAVLLFVPHTTAAITVNEDESNLRKDLENFYGDLFEGNWKHNNIDNNAEAHLGSSTIGASLTLPVKESNLDLGTWQDILFIELDGPRKREIRIVEL